ncbi:craniofacial development protein 2-like protein [Plakobranchus ocellatus]|uniref:Craniofacial development protein 2-like protein n=1 Tax=Plakobranchus ocellatus TaxID=259542 RepID=A0AAV3YTB8_9GAST|nr:craniofacial development protein 2-like protein [Plakobranchus ocellatus]
MLTSTLFGRKNGILRGQTSSTKYSPTWEKTSTKEVKEQAENGRHSHSVAPGGTESEKGVGIIVDQTVTKAIKGYWALSDRVLLVKIAGKPVDLNIIQVYAPTANSNDEDLDKFYNELDTAKTQCKSQDPLIIMGDFNAKVGTEKVDDIVGKHGLGIRNERGEKLIEWCQTNNIIMGNTWFQQPPRRKWTWKSPGDETRNQIDYMMISKRYRNALLLAKTYPSVDCYSAHIQGGAASVDT